MGGEQAVGVLATVRRDNIEAEGRSWSAEEEEAFKAPIRERYEAEGNPTTRPRASGTTASSCRRRRATCWGWRSRRRSTRRWRRHGSGCSGCEGLQPLWRARAGVCRAAPAEPWSRSRAPLRRGGARRPFARAGGGSGKCDPPMAGLRAHSLAVARRDGDRGRGRRRALQGRGEALRTEELQGARRRLRGAASCGRARRAEPDRRLRNRRQPWPRRCLGRPQGRRPRRDLHP